MFNKHGAVRVRKPKENTVARFDKQSLRSVRYKKQERLLELARRYRLKS